MCKKPCSISGCERPFLAKGVCGTHYARYKATGSYDLVLRASGCSKENCQGKYYGRGLCSRHFEEFRRASGYHAKAARKPETRFTDCKRYAKERNLEWSISLENYKNLLKPNKCSYCFGPLPETKVGLDRKDNFKGYTLENVVPCCRYCNQMRSNIFSFDEFVEFSKTDLFQTVLNRLHNKDIK